MTRKNPHHFQSHDFLKGVPLQASSFWVRKEKEEMNLNLNSLAVSRMLAHYSWKEVIVTLEGYFVSKSLLNPFMDEKAVFLRISLVDGLFG